MKYVLGILIACALSVTNADISTRYIRERTRIVGQDTSTVPGSVITTYRQGNNQWAMTNVLRVVNRPIERPVRYSKLKLIVAAKAAGKWAEVKAAIAAMDLEDEWNACQFITSDYPAYISATNAVVTQGIATEAEVKAFMSQAIDN